jgi:hypothetical protein
MEPIMESMEKKKIKYEALSGYDLEKRTGTVKKNANINEGYKISALLNKINRNGKQQKRTILITGEAIYNFDCGTWDDFNSKTPLSDI